MSVEDMGIVNVMHELIKLVEDKLPSNEELEAVRLIQRAKELKGKLIEERVIIGDYFTHDGTSNKYIALAPKKNGVITICDVDTYNTYGELRKYYKE